MKNLKNLGVVLSRIEQQTINGGVDKCCVKVPRELTIQSISSASWCNPSPECKRVRSRCAC